MGARAEQLASQFEAKAREAEGVFDRLTDTDWKKVTTAEKWPVGVVAHHVATAHEGLGNLVKALGAGQTKGDVSMDMVHAMNAKHAQEHAGCAKAETIALHRKNAAAAAAIVRGLSDAELDRSGPVLQGMPDMTAAQLAGSLLVGHPDEHLASIRATVGA